jgi:hypothetical protein
MTSGVHREGSSDDAHLDATPVVPCAHAITGRGPAGRCFDAITTALATAGASSSRVVV